MIPKNLLLTAVLSLLCLGFSYEAISQKPPKDKYRHRATKDTLVIQLGENDRLAIPVKSVRQFELESVNALLVKLNQDLGTALDSLTDAPVTVLYQEAADGERRLQVTTKPAEQSEMYYVRETGVIKQRVSLDSIIVERANKQKLFFVLKRITALKAYESRNVDSLIAELRKEIAGDNQLNGMKNASIPFGGWLKVTYLTEANRKDEKWGRKIRVDYSEDFGLVLIAGTGVGVVRDKVVPELGAGIGYRFPRSKSYLGLKLTLHYFFNRRADDSYAMDINSFLSVDLGEIKSGNALSIGYLIHRSGGYFKGTTFKISQTVGAGKMGKLRLIPELIITDNFRVYFPGIRLGIMF
jgi:hypothetical protein